jgi:hypothetical protein
VTVVGSMDEEIEDVEPALLRVVELAESVTDFDLSRADCLDRNLANL